MNRGKVGLAIIGVGHWGKNYLRNFNALSKCEILWACDLDESNLEYVRENYPQVQLTRNFLEVFQDKRVRACVVATQASQHARLAKLCLQMKKDVLVEKAMALNAADCSSLIEQAEEEKAILMVGHTFLFNDAVHLMKRLIEQGEIGELYYIKAVRSHLGLIREDVNSAWDLATHDLSIFSFMLRCSPTQVMAAGSSFLKQGREDVTFITLRYGKVLASIHVSWADTNKQRTVEVVGSKGRILFDDLNALEPIRIFQRGIGIDQDVSNFGEFKYLLRDGDIVSPNIKMTEPLKNQCNHFLDCVIQRKQPLTDGEFGADIVSTLCQVDESLIAGRC